MTNFFNFNIPAGQVVRSGRSVPLIICFGLTVGLAGAFGLVKAAKPANAQISSQAREIFVALNGSDTSGDGSIGDPYRTLRKAARNAAPGDTVYVRGGTYTGVKDSVYGVDGAAAQPITIRPFANETVIFDGTGASISRSESVVLIGESSYIIFDGFEIRNSSGRGISTYESHHITIRNNNVHHVQSRGLSAAGDNIVFEYNEVWQAVLENENEAMGSSGWSAAVSANERADGSWSTNIFIRNNHVHDCWGEGISPSHANGVIIRGNTVHDTYSLNIYLSSSNGVTVNGNYVYATTATYNRSDRNYPAHGIGLGSETPSAGMGAYMNNVVIANNLIAGTGVGINYWQSGLGDPENSYRDLKIFYNVILATHRAAIYFYEVGNGFNAPSGVLAANNIIHAGNDGATLVIGNPEAWTFTHNNWPDGVPNLAGMAAASDNFSAPPQFVSPVVGGNPAGFKLRAGSSSIGAGTPVTVTTDYWGSYRGNPPTIGLHEYSPVVLDKKVFLPLIQKRR